MIKRKNILAENMLRFRSKNIAAQEAAAIRKLIEAQTADTAKYKNPTDIDDFFTGTANGAMPLAPRDAETVIFATTLKPGLSEYAAKSGNTHAIELPGTNFYLAVGRIGIVDNNVNPSVKSETSAAILFYATAATATDNGIGRITPIKFIPYANNLAKFANDIVRATNPGAGNKVGTFQRIEKQIAAVLEESASLGITGADKLVPSSDPTSYYAKWKLATEKLLNAA